jgi:voltage-gated potassium channel
MAAEPEEDEEAAMAAPRYEDLPRRARRRLLVLALLRPAVVAGGLGLIYYRLPLASAWGGRTVIGFLLGLIALVILVAWQARAIAHDPYPRLRGIEALATAVAYFLILFASTYFLAARSEPGAFSEPLTRTDALYFAVTIFTSVGFGDITAVTQPARVMVTIQMLGSLAFLGVGARVLVTAVQSNLRRTRDRTD